MKRRFLTFLLYFCLTVTLFAGCDTSDNAENNSKPQNDTTEVILKRDYVSFDEDPYSYFNVSFGDYHFNLVDANGEYEELSEQLVGKGWADQVKTGAEAAKSGKHRFKYGTNLYYYSEGNRYSHSLILNFKKKELANLEFELFGGITQNTSVEELMEIWGEPDYCMTQAPIYYYLSPCGKYFIELFYPKDEETSGIYRVTFYYSEEINCNDYFKVYADPKNEKDLVMWIQPGMIELDYRTGTYTKDIVLKNTEAETEEKTLLAPQE